MANKIEMDNVDSKMLSKDQVKKSLGNIRQIKLRFWSQIQELKEVSQSTNDILAEDKITEDDFKTLETKLRGLWDLRHEFEANVNSFSSRFESRFPQEVHDADKSFEDALDAYLDIKPNVDNQLLKLRKLLDLNVRKETVQDQGEDKPDDIGVDFVSERSNQSSQTVSYIEKIAKGIALTVVFYIFLGSVISHSLKSTDIKTADSTLNPNNWTTNNQTCGANSFQLRDSVCDDSSNTAICLYDGGDCCLEFKDTKLCKKCACILQVDDVKLLDHFRDRDILPLENPNALETAVNNKWTVKVEGVVSGKVCSMLCIEHQNQTYINSWHYQTMPKGLCRCGWVESVHCPRETMMVDYKWTLNTSALSDSDQGAFVQLKKVVPCRKLLLFHKKTMMIRSLRFFQIVWQWGS